MFLEDATPTGGGGPSISDAVNAVKNSFDKLSSIRQI